jgi:hypothetical protein
MVHAVDPSLSVREGRSLACIAMQHERILPISQAPNMADSDMAHI